MLACLDVDYRPDVTVAACVLFRAWTDAEEVRHVLARGPVAEPYVPGQFYRRELPHLLRVLAATGVTPGAVVIDGYVWLAEARPGLGAHLFEALGRHVPVVGVAKTAFRASDVAVPVLRGHSQRPLHVTAAGMEAQAAAACVRAMHGDARIPTLLRRVDRLARAP